MCAERLKYLDEIEGSIRTLPTSLPFRSVSKQLIGMEEVAGEVRSNVVALERLSKEWEALTTDHLEKIRATPQ
jgi:hypothetical protein